MLRLGFLPRLVNYTNVDYATIGDSVYGILFAYIVVSVMSINIVSNAQKWQINESIGDGHCLLYSVLNSWNMQCRKTPPLDLHEIKCKFFLKSIERSSLYIAFLSNPECYALAVRKYLVNKCYNQDLVDIAPTIIANSLNIQLNIINETEGSYNTISVIPINNKPKHQISIHCCNGHYNGLKYLDSSRTNNYKTYTSAELFRIGNERSHKISRPLQKILFRLFIWEPTQTGKQDHTLNSKLFDMINVEKG